MTIRVTLASDEAEALRDLLTQHLLDPAFRFGDEEKMKSLLRARNKIDRRLQNGDDD